ncbi:MAG: hypothetical protein HQL73_10525 [Magnetococcales bacterium]|nr:hypothetical protein [Magnetococcales bacterium]
MAVTAISFKALDMAMSLFHWEEHPRMPGSVVADFHPDEGKILMEQGIFTEGELCTVVPNRHTFEAEAVEPEWNEETRTYQYFSFDDGMWVDVPEDDMKSYLLDLERTVRHVRDLAGLEGEPRLVVRNLLWNLGTFWLGNRKATVYLARLWHQTDRFDEIYDALRRLGGKSPGVVLAWKIPKGRHVTLPHGHRMVGLKESLIVEGDAYRLDMEMVRSVLTGEHVPVDDLSPVRHSGDYSTVRVNGREFVFTGMKQKQVIGILVESWRRGEARCRTQVVLEEVESSADAIGQLFRGRSDWRDLIGQGDGFCWLKV